VDPEWNVDLVGRKDEWGIVSGKGVIYVDKGAGPNTQSWGFLSNITLEPNGQ